MSKSRALKSFHANGNIKCSCVVNENNIPISPILEWDLSGRLIREIRPENCDVVFAKPRAPMDDVQAKIKALEDRIAELERRLKVPTKMEPDEIRAKFAELMSLIDPRSLQRVLTYFEEGTIAGSMLDLTEELKTRILACFSSNRKKETIEMMEILKSGPARMTLVVDETDNVTLKHVEMSIVDYALPHKVVILEQISSLERRGEIVVGRAGGDEVFV